MNFTDLSNMFIERVRDGCIIAFCVLGLQRIDSMSHNIARIAAALEKLANK